MSKVGIAFQGGGFAGGAIATGAVTYLITEGYFDDYDIHAFSGTSSGALVASVCWGHMLERKKEAIRAIPEALKAQWKDLAFGTVPNAQTAEMYELTDSVCGLNPLYQFWSRNTVVPCFRQMYQDWVQRHIKIEHYQKLWSQHPHLAPKLRIGATDILHGTPKVFREKAFSLEVLTATGSLEDTIGITEVKNGSKLEDYIDGGWAVNPPLKTLLDCDVDEIWLIEVFPHSWSSKPRSPMEGKSRRDELWQYALLLQELDFIEKVNEWCKDQAWANQHGYRNIKVRRIKTQPDLMIGSVFVNEPAFIAQMMDFGYRNAATLFGKAIPKTSPFSNEAQLETPLTWMTRHANTLSQWYASSFGA
jgi:predicted acylesterase/phospholipase RssA